MFVEAQKSYQTIAVYNADAIKFVAKYCREREPDACDMPHETRVCLAVRSFLRSHNIWSANYIRRLAAALYQQVELLVLMELIPDDPNNPEGSLLWLLKNKRPDPVKKGKKGDQGKKTKQRKKYRKSVKLTELRQLIEYFRDRADGFSLWIAGYIILASRLGWRPGEMLMLQREGHFLRAAAEKHTNGRGLTDTCEIDIGAYFEKSRLFKSPSLTSEFDKWIADTRKWEAYYGGLAGLQDNINSRLATACKKCKIKRVCTYTFRHFAISCLKASGFSRAEIAVIVNHATDRTAAEHYGRRRDGFKRAKKMLRFNNARLPFVRRRAREFDRSAALSVKP
jgi:integrase